MYTKEQIKTALKEFERLGSVQATITLLGYPSSSSLYKWYERKLANKKNYHGSPQKPYNVEHRYINSAEHPRYPDTNLKLEAIKRCFSLGENVEYVSREIGYSRMSIYKWYRQYKKYGVSGPMSSKKQIKRENIDFNAESAPAQDIAELQEQIKQLQMEVDVLKEALNLLKKDPGINITELKNREKAVVIDAMKDKYSLPQLLKLLQISKSSFYYQKKAMKKPDKYYELRINIIQFFKENRNCYGYRLIHSELKKTGIAVSEKIVRHIMKAEKLTVPDSLLVNKMLEVAISTISPSEHPIVHTDRGSHYRWPGWIDQMNTAGLTRSMSKKGCSPDNAACEGFFGRLKNEMFYGRSWIDVSINSFIDEINNYIIWYNTKRIKQSLGYMSPVEYRHSLGVAV